MSLKKRVLVLVPIFSVVFLIIALVLTGVLFADANMIQNGDFESGNANWLTGQVTGVTGTFKFEGGVAKVRSDTYGNTGTVWIYQAVMASSKDMDLYFDVKRISTGYRESSSIIAEVELLLGTSPVGELIYDYQEGTLNFPVDGNWHRDNLLNLDLSSFSDFDKVKVDFIVNFGGEAWFDNIRLFGPGIASQPLTPYEWVLLDLNSRQLRDLYGPTPQGFIEMLYDNILNRVYDVEGRDYWMGQFTGGVMNAGQIVEQFIFDNEVASKVAAMTQEEFVAFLYQALLARTPDTEGLSQWVSFMAMGNSRMDTLRAFLNNPEWSGICAMYNVKP